MEKLLFVRNLVKQYPGNEGVDNIGFTITFRKMGIFIDGYTWDYLQPIVSF